MLKFNKNLLVSFTGYCITHYSFLTLSLNKCVLEFGVKRWLHLKVLYISPLQVTGWDSE